MTEELFAYAILFKVGLLPREDYNCRLDALFLSDGTNSLLLELEWYSSNPDETYQIMECAAQSQLSFAYDLFGQFLFDELEQIYRKHKCNMQDFGAKVYRIWQLLPSDFNQKEPFWTLSYADDCLSWDDENQTRNLYEKAFRYYSK